MKATTVQLDAQQLRQILEPLKGISDRLERVEALLIPFSEETSEKCARCGDEPEPGVALQVVAGDKLCRECKVVVEEVPV